MVRLLATCAMSSLATFAAAAEPWEGHELSLGLDVGYVDVSGYPSWTEHAVGKLRYSDDGLVMNRAYLDYRGRLRDTVTLHAVLEAYDDDLGGAIDFTQAYIEWRPVPSSATRYRLKAGAFYPAISLENVAAAWSSPYTISSSAINTWIAEEIRTVGVELSASRRPASLGGAHDFSVDVAAFWGNDPAGSLLAWKGWSLHDRQSRLGDELPLAPLPQIQPGMMFAAQDPYVAPFREIDGRAGYYLNASWHYRERLGLRAGLYDNRADPTEIEDGQYAWETAFATLAMQATLPGEIGFIAQWMSGDTVMGPAVFANGVHAVDAEFDSWFALLSKASGRHRVSLRYDDFDVTQNDQMPQDNNEEDGHAWTVAYLLALTDRLGIAAEWLSIRSDRPAWMYFGLDTPATETQFQLLLRLRL